MLAHLPVWLLVILVAGGAAIRVAGGQLSTSPDVIDDRPHLGGAASASARSRRPHRRHPLIEIRDVRS